MEQNNDHSGTKIGYLPYLLPVRSVMFLLIFLAGAFFTKQDVSGISNWWSVVASAVNIVTILFLVIASKKAGGSYAGLINYKKGRRRGTLIVDTGIIFAIIIIGMAGMCLAGHLCYGALPYFPPMMVEPVPVILAVINVAVLPVSTALAEDGLYLGGGVNQIGNKYAAILVPAFFYALQHCFIPTLFDTKYIIYRFLSFLPLTVFLCVYYYRKRDPVPVMIAHAILDLATAMTILATSAVPGLYEQMI